MRGDDRPITLGRVLASDVVYSALYFAGALVVLGPYLIARSYHAGGVWEFASLAGAFVLVAILGVLAFRFRRRAMWPLTWLEDTFAQAKARRDLSRDYERLSMQEKALAYAFLVLSMLAVLTPLVLSALYQAHVLVLVCAALSSLALPAIRLSVYAGVHVSAWFNGRRAR